ncbi:zinc finger bed domain-containing protein 1-like [Gigaspora margarita]|uniref:Zinc finger bed domain-containing protein 1-like n=1 Tax=Gigaspora margarita TaxID=4874 RepID=A0A8H3XFZ4_GIGMA|nr:zinc finger bed domain-containing protein 1-like [Gigaspora margarita]
MIYIGVAIPKTGLELGTPKWFISKILSYNYISLIENNKLNEDDRLSKNNKSSEDDRLNEDDRLSEGQLLDYISNDYNIFASDDNNNSEENSQNNSGKEAIQKSNLNISSKPLLSAKRKRESKVSAKLKSSFVWEFFSQPTNRKPYSKIQIQKLNNSLFRFIINSIQPPSIVEDRDFIKYSYNLNPKYKLPYEVKNLITKFQLESKLYAIITDNGSNIKSAINQLRIGTHIPCTAHTLQLSILKEVKEIDQLVTKCKNLISFLAQDKKQQQLKEAKLYLIIQQESNNSQLDDDKEYIFLNVVKANNTRWNLVYYVFECLIILQSTIIALKETLLEDINSRTRQEREILEELIPFIYK